MKINFSLSNILSFVYDLLMIPIAWMLAVWMRFDFGVVPETFLHSCLHALGLVFTIQCVLFFIYGSYRGLWRFSSIKDLVTIFKAVLLGSLLIAVSIHILFKIEHIPRSIPFIYSILLIGLLCLTRLSFRISKTFSFRSEGKKRVLIIGAGQAGEGLARDLLEHSRKSREYHLLGFIDDEKTRLGKEIHGIRVLGSSHHLNDLVRKYNIDFIFIAIPSLTTLQMQRLVKICESSQVPFRTLPGKNHIIDGKVSVDLLREVSIEDLFGRQEIAADISSIASTIKNKVILVTGGGGSIGSQLCRLISQYQPTKLIIIDHCEYNLYAICQEIKNNYPEVNLQDYLLDITDQAGCEQIFKLQLPHIVFHAAAYKHVPLLEENIRVAVLNNVIGTKVLAETAIEYQVEKFILISTDKAVYPASVMGCTKRIAELICQNLNGYSKVKFITVRFGNVLDSKGSVIPLFRQQIEAGGPITLTHPDIERYFMTIPEACFLIIQAAAMGQGGEVFVLNMGKPIKIYELAKQLIKLSQRDQDKIKIVYTGLRPGEKLTEELFYKYEQISKTEHEKIMKVQTSVISWEIIITQLEKIMLGVNKQNDQLILAELKNMVPEFSSKIILDSKLVRAEAQFI